LWTRVDVSQLILQDIAHGTSVIVVDAHGELHGERQQAQDVDAEGGEQLRLVSAVDPVVHPDRDDAPSPVRRDVL
jgi:hypothetical protein